MASQGDPGSLTLDRLKETVGKIGWFLSGGRRAGRGAGSQTDDAMGTTKTGHCVDVVVDLDNKGLEVADGELNLIGKEHRATVQRRQNCRSIAVALAVFLAFGGVVYAVASGLVKGAMLKLARLPLQYSAPIVVAALVFTAQPIGYGFTVVAIAAGFAMGWVALPLVFFGINLGNVVAFRLVCTCCSGTSPDELVMKVNSAKLRRWLLGILTSLTVYDGFRGLMVIVATRMAPIPIGLQNAAFAAARVPFWFPLLPGSLIGTIPDCIMSVYSGVLIKQATESGQGQSKLQIAMLVLQIVAVIALMILLPAAVKRSLKLQDSPYMEEDDGDAATDDNDSNDADSDIDGLESFSSDSLVAVEVGPVPMPAIGHYTIIVNAAADPQHVPGQRRQETLTVSQV